MTDRIPGAPGRCKAVVTGEELQKLRAGEEFAITLRRDDQPIREGTPYSKAAVLPDAVAIKLCPGAQDPTPGDAFAALESQKADAVRRTAGQSITLRDATHTPLKGFRILGQADGCVGDTGSITVMVAGKNLLDYRKAYARNSMQTVTVDESINGLYWTGTYYFVIPVYVPAGTTIRFSCEMESVDGSYDSHCDRVDMIYADGTSQYVNVTVGDVITLTKDLQSIRPHKANTDDNNQVKVWNLQLEIGTAVTEYEPYQAPQILTVSTAAGDQVGLNGDGNVCDEIDFIKGVLIHRVFEEREYPLPEEVLEAYAKLHTYTPTTVITNDTGADMEVTYYTPTTAVQMVQGAANKGKTFTVDEHGCVALTKDNPVIACGETTLNEATWYYRKWADGFAECWSRFGQNFEIVNEAELGNTIAAELLLPFSFWPLEAPLVYVTLADAITDTDVPTGSLHLLTMDVFDGESVYLTLITTDKENVYAAGSIYVNGRWKAPEGLE